MKDLVLLALNFSIKILYYNVIKKQTVMIYKIYQLDLSKESVKNSRKLFERWEWLIKYDGGFNFQDYKQVYEGETNLDEKFDDITILDNLFTKFNLNHPEDFHGHSLSVSDVIVLGDKMYFCDDFGWKEIL